MSFSDADELARRDARLVQPRTPGQLRAYVSVVLGFAMPRTPLVAGHDSPFDYLVHSFFEQRPGGASPDCIVWANRGGGKTQLGAIATLLDMLFKPGIQIRILGGSFEQSSKMHRYLRQMLLNDVFIDLVKGNCTGRFVELTNGSRVEVLSQSERSIRGQRVHKVRCDEVELFDPAVWEAAQLTTRSGRCGDIFVPGSIEALSTMHRPFGLMQKLVREADQAGRRVFRWSVLDTLTHCPEWRACEKCELWTDCQGRAKHPGARGFLRIDDAIRQRHRVGQHIWRSEMLCEQPDRSESVYPEFDVDVHVIDAEQWTMPAGDVELCGGIDFGYRSPTVVLWAVHDPATDCLIVFDELVVREHTTEQVISRVMGQHRSQGEAYVLMKTLSIAGGGVPGAAGPWFGADPAGHSRNEHTGSSTIALWKKAGFTIRTRRMEIDAGVAAVRSRLRRADGSVGLKIHQRCKHLIDAMLRYRYPASAAGTSDDFALRDDVSPLKDGPDHACDALRYMVINLNSDQNKARTRPY